MIHLLFFLRLQVCAGRNCLKQSVLVLLPSVQAQVMGISIYGVCSWMWDPIGIRGLVCMAIRGWVGWLIFYCFHGRIQCSLAGHHQNTHVEITTLSWSSKGRLVTQLAGSLVYQPLLFVGWHAGSWLLGPYQERS